MKFTTTRFGEIEYPEDVVLHLPEGVLGFPRDRRFILLEHNAEGSPFRWLQSLDSADLAFIVVDPVLIEPHYQLEIDRDSARVLGTDDPAQCAIIAIVNVPHDNPVAMTANLKAPVVINAETRVGRQIVLGSNRFLLNTPVFPAININLHAQSEEMQAEREYELHREAASG